MVQCAWCDEEYESDPNLEQEHLIRCEAFQSLPVKEITTDGRTFVEFEPGILVERRRKVNWRWRVGQFWKNEGRR